MEFSMLVDERIKKDVLFVFVLFVTVKPAVASEDANWDLHV